MKSVWYPRSRIRLDDTTNIYVCGGVARVCGDDDTSGMLVCEDEAPTNMAASKKQNTPRLLAVHASAYYTNHPTPQPHTHTHTNLDVVQNPPQQVRHHRQHHQLQRARLLPHSSIRSVARPCCLHLRGRVPPRCPHHTRRVEVQKEGGDLLHAVVDEAVAEGEDGPGQRAEAKGKAGLWACGGWGWGGESVCVCVWANAWLVR